ncbi:MAG TPA: DNA cytosine methyltransferase [Tissierellaceae bacterium]|nr:DNA cytosine methyltransferase [Tissierellaceae bacterium]
MKNNKEILGGIYTGASKEFQRGVAKDISRTLKANLHDAGIVEKIIFEERADEGARTFKDNCVGTIRTIDSGGDKRVAELNRLGNIYGEGKGTGYAGNVWDKEGLCPTLTTMEGGNREPMIVASRGRNPNNPSDREKGSPTEQRLEPNSEGICNTITTVQKDNMVLEPKVVQAVGDRGNHSYSIKDNAFTVPANPMSDRGQMIIESPYRIRKLTPLECWRLMKFTDEDFYKAEKVNSNSQLYKQAGNSIVVSVLEGIFKQMM